MITKKREDSSTGEGSYTCRTQISQEARLDSAKRARLDSAKRAKSLSHSAKQRLKWIEHFNKYRNARLTCRHFGISPDTFYLWRKRFIADNLKTLEDDFKTRKPHKTRVSKHKKQQLETIKKLKNIDPRLGKTRIAKILRETGYKISSSTVARILKKYKD